MNNRLLSLDVMRGLTVIGMVVVNSASVFHYSQKVPVFGFMLHAEWAGLTAADLVFPFFIFMVGVSIPFALSGVKEREGLTGKITLKLARRGALLFLIGLALTLSFADWQEPIRVLGVLQRIGLTFVAASLLFMAFGWRSLAIIASAILVLYDPVTLIPITDAQIDLARPGQNFSSWLDRILLGDHVYARNSPIPFEPEGILGTLPSIAQALLGILAGLWLRRQQGTGLGLRRLVQAGVVITAIGLGWSLLFPMVKAIWSSAFVLVTTGLAILLLALLHYALDDRAEPGYWAIFAQAFGINAITAYVLHSYLMQPVLASDLNLSLFSLGSAFMPAEWASLPSILLVVIATWIPVAIMQKKEWVLKI